VQDSGGFNIASMEFTGVTSAAVSSLGVNPASVVGGAPSTGTVTLTAPAVQSIGPDGLTVLNGQAVLIASDNAAATVASGANVITSGGNSYVVVPATKSSATFTVHTTAVGSTTTAHLTATLGTAKTSTLTITPFVAQPPPPPTGLTATATVTQN